MTLSVPLLDGFDRSGRIREATAGERAARSSYEQLRPGPDGEVAHVE